MSAIKSYIKDGYINKRNESPIYISVYVERKKIEIPCKINVNIKYWDKPSGKVKIGEKNHKELNMMITQAKSKLNEILVRYRLQNKTLTKELLLDDYYNPKDFKSFYDFVEWSQKLRFQEIEQSTASRHRSVINKLKEFSPTLLFSDLKEDFIRKYILYQRKELGNKEITINKNIDTLNIYIREAIKRGYMDVNPISEIKRRATPKNDITALTEEELKVLTDMYKKNILPGQQHKVLEFFLFMVYTSLHISDAKCLKIEQITKTDFTYFRVKNRNSKPEPITIPLSIPAKKIIKNIVGYRVRGLLFSEIISDQKINKNLKKIAIIADINKTISAKTARHTFATIYLRKTKDLNSLKELLGHSNVRETLMYAHVLDDDKQEGIKVFNSLFD